MPGTSGTAPTGGNAAASTLAGGRRGRGTTRGLGQPPELDRRFRERARRPHGHGSRLAGEFLFELLAASVPVAEREPGHHTAPAPGLAEAAGQGDRLDDQAADAVRRDLLVGDGGRPRRGAERS